MSEKQGLQFFLLRPDVLSPADALASADLRVRAVVADLDFEASLHYKSGESNPPSWAAFVNSGIEEKSNLSVKPVIICSPIRPNSRDGNIITKNIFNTMHAALGKRNAAAHPNAVVIDKLQTDAFIADLITNVVQQIV